MAATRPLIGWHRTSLWPARAVIGPWVKIVQSCCMNYHLISKWGAGGSDTEPLGQDEDQKPSWQPQSPPPPSSSHLDTTAFKRLTLIRIMKVRIISNTIFNTIVNLSPDDVTWQLVWVWAPHHCLEPAQLSATTGQRLIYVHTWHFSIWKVLSFFHSFIYGSDIMVAIHVF